MFELIKNPLMLPIVFPLVAGTLCLLFPKKAGAVCGLWAVAASLITVTLVWPLFSGPASTYDHGNWVHLKNDMLSRFILLAVTIFGALISIYSMGYMKGKERLPEYYAYLLWTTGASCGALLANDFLGLLVFWGFIGFTLYLLIGIAGPTASGAAKKGFIVVGGADCLLILGVAMFWQMTGTTRMDGGQIAFVGARSYFLFFCIASAAFAKASAMPFHSWVPDAGEKGPASVSAFLPASLDKLLGIYLLARISSGLFVMNHAVNTVLMFLGAMTILGAVMAGLVQHDMKRLFSYHAVSQVGYMLLGIGTGTPLGMAGGLFHMLNNAIYKSSLFLCAGAVESKTGTTDLDRLGGLGKTMPLTFITCLVASLSISGIPPLNGFASKWMIYQGIIDSGKNNGFAWVLWLAAAMLGSALTLASFVKILHAAFLCKPSPEVAGKKIQEVGFFFWLPMLTLATVCVVTGVFASRLPLKYCIFPAVGGVVPLLGSWWAGPATLLLIVAFAVGGLLYLASTARKARISPTYIGGENLDTVYISDEPTGAQRHVEVTGVDFYETFRDLPGLRSLYKIAETKIFDLYETGTSVVFYFINVLKKAHNGLLPMYLTWVLVGLLAVLALVFSGGIR